jgi:putative aldouronate transport system permease protein
MKRSNGRVVFGFVNGFLLVLFCLLVILPFMHIISVSVSDKDAITKMSVGIFPKGFNLGAYKEIITEQVFLRALLNTVFLTVVVTVLGIIVDIMASYCFSRKFFGKKVITYLFIFTMYFTGGLIPLYLLVTRYLHLFNSYFALILPGLVNVWYIIIVRTQIEAIPDSLTEAARIDGAKDYQILFSIIIPAISSTIAAIGMFIALAAWNQWFNVMIFTDKRQYWTLQYYLRCVVFDKTVSQSGGQAARATAAAAGLQTLTAENFQMAAIVLVALPIIMIYPFMQKYFVSGILTGSVKE